MLDRQAERLGDRTLVVFDRGPTWSYTETRRLARGTAAALESLGVKRGDRVLVWLPTGPAIVRVALALTYLGAIYVPINTAFRGRSVEHIIQTSRSSLLIAHDQLLDRLNDLELGELEQIVVVGEVPRATLSGRECLPEREIEPLGVEPTPLSPALEPWDIQAIFYTSGTTGPSKGVLCSHVHTWNMSVGGIPFLQESDRFMSPSAYFHIADAYVPWAVIAKGASMAVVGAFRTQDFWEQVIRTATTATVVIGAMADFLLKAPEQPDDADNPLRVINQQPLAHDASAFARRFGVLLYTQYDLTELGPPIAAEVFGPETYHKKGYCGRLRDGFEVRLVDENDCEVALGQAGEVAVRSTIPWIITTGYFGMPQATARAWRNGWFHTGDVLRLEQDGSYYYVDRVKDSIRRRGENISSVEVEQEVLAYPSVRAVAAYGVASEHGEEEVMVTLEPKPGEQVDPSALIEFLIPRMPHFMVPRYVRVMDELPRSATDKIQKPDLREQGRTDDTWDRERAGIKLKRDAVSSGATRN